MQDIVTVYMANFESSAQPQAFPLQGSKRGQVPVINRLIPEGRPRLVEPFCGSAAVSIGARYHDLVGDVIISDINASLMHLWSEILDNPQAVSDGYAEIWTKQFEEGVEDYRQYFNGIRDTYNDREPGVEDAPTFLFILNRIVKAALRYSSSGKMNQSADRRRSGAKPGTVAKRVLDTSRVLSGATALHRGWITAINESNPEDIVYLDPPYQGTSNVRDNRYISGLTVDEFETGVRLAMEKSLSVIISYDAIVGPITYGRPLDSELGLLALDVVTGVSAQSTLLGRAQEAHETLYLTPALVERLGGVEAVKRAVRADKSVRQGLF